MHTNFGMWDVIPSVSHSGRVRSLFNIPLYVSARYVYDYRSCFHYKFAVRTCCFQLCVLDIFLLMLSDVIILYPILGSLLILISPVFRQNFVSKVSVYIYVVAPQFFVEKFRSLLKQMILSVLIHPSFISSFLCAVVEIFCLKSLMIRFGFSVEPILYLRVRCSYTMFVWRNSRLM